MKIETYTNSGKEEFMSSDLIQDAVIRNLEIVGEATKRVSQGIKEQHQEIPWRQMAGLRDVLIHDYMGISHYGVNMVSFIAALTMGLISVASAYFATKDLRDTALNLRGMFNLPFLPTDQMIIVLIVVGGAGLVLTQYWITKRLTQLAYRIGNDVS